ncbi:hypothetical protein [Geobacter sp. SVR]|uniref:Bbp19 family protein n=1 Tax=Geobacter sp. SVR TaxID=2495594 RepID=UPI00143EF834|nr:hypothetical protein [Geobacter sp. SVR]BCS54773.1 phage endoprotease [Geobacter sp. SVR]GCF86419.1 phage endoprotease [Geobacter sp. SVR]
MTRDETINFLRREQQIDDMKAVMSTPEGRRFIWRQLGEAGVFRPSFVAGSPDTTSFNEGSRNCGLLLLAEIMSEAPENFLIMQKEAIENERRNKKETDRNIGRGDFDN